MTSKNIVLVYIFDYIFKNIFSKFLIVTDYWRSSTEKNNVTSDESW